MAIDFNLIILAIISLATSSSVSQKMWINSVDVAGMSSAMRAISYIL
jgi:hypothetical protein